MIQNITSKWNSCTFNHKIRGSLSIVKSHEIVGLIEWTHQKKIHIDTPLTCFCCASMWTAVQLSSCFGVLFAATNDDFDSKHTETTVKNNNIDDEPILVQCSTYDSNIKNRNRFVLLFFFFSFLSFSMSVRLTNASIRKYKQLNAFVCFVVGICFIYAPSLELFSLVPRFKKWWIVM